MAAENSKLHIAMFPWLAFGHMIPFLELSKLIAQKGHKVSFVCTPRNISRLPKLPPNLSNLINFVTISLPKNDDLPVDAEATTDLPYHKVQYLKLAYDGMQDSVVSFLQETSPDWVFYDFAPYWLIPVVAKLNIPSAYFSIFNATGVGFMSPAPGDDFRKDAEDFTVTPPWIPFPTTVRFRLYEIRKMLDSFTRNESGVSDTYRCGAALKGCDVIVIRSCYELEPEWLKLVEELNKKPVIPIGQLPPSRHHDDSEDNDDGLLFEIKVFLEKQVKGSVVYVAFGSEAKPSQDELNEIAHGLELSGLPLIWALQLRRGCADTELLQLPEGFENRVKGRGVVYTSWVPQLKILSHSSVGGFLTHSGWSSVVEAIYFEKALILLTFLADQGLNARLLEEKKLGYAIPRDEQDGSFTRDTVADSLRLVVVAEEGKVYREKVKEMKPVFCDKDRQEQYIDNLLDFLRGYRKLEKLKEPNGDL